MDIVALSPWLSESISGTGVLLSDRIKRATGLATDRGAFAMQNTGPYFPTFGFFFLSSVLCTRVRLRRCIVQAEEGRGEAKRALRSP